MKCWNCGKDNKKGAEFCRFCGKNLKNPEQTLTPSFVLKALFLIYVLIFLAYNFYLLIEPAFHNFVDKIATKF